MTRPHVIACIILGYTSSLAAYEPPLQEPQYLKLRLSDAALQLAISGSKDSGHSAGGDSYERDTLSYEPTATVRLRGFAYHPNLLIFSLQPVIGYQHSDTRDSLQTPQHSVGTEKLINYNASADILKQKPYAVHLDASHQIQDREDIFASHTRVESTMYSVRSGYNEGPVPVTFMALHSEELSHDTLRPYDNSDDSLIVNSHNSREHGSSTLNYNYSKYRYSESDAETDGQSSGSFISSGSRQTINATDDESLAGRDKYHLYSSASYNEQSDANLNVTDLHLGETLRIAHTEKLNSQYTYNYNDVENGISESISHQGSMSLHHQLFSSLASSADISGERDEDSGINNSVDTEKYGGGFNEAYSKRIPWNGKLSLHYGHHEEWTTRNASGSSLAIIDESHVLNDGDITFLNQLNPETASIIVTDAGGMRVYRNGLDYLVIPRGARTQIQRLVGGFIPNGSTVLVNYIATSSPSDSFHTIADSYGMGLTLWTHLTLYVNESVVRNKGSESEISQNVRENLVGATVTWPHFQAGIEHLIYDSDISSYKTWRLFETLQYRLTDYSSLYLDFRQQEISFNDGSNDERVYSFLSRIEAHYTSSLSFNLQAAANLDRGYGTEDYSRNIYSGTAYAIYQVGKLSTRIDLQYQQSNQLSDRTESEYAGLTLGRTF